LFLSPFLLNSSNDQELNKVDTSEIAQKNLSQEDKIPSVNLLLSNSKIFYEQTPQNMYLADDSQTVVPGQPMQSEIERMQLNIDSI
jgi:hypothetical protein